VQQIDPEAETVTTLNKTRHNEFFIKGEILAYKRYNITALKIIPPTIRNP
jgi:hypothetical protein